MHLLNLTKNEGFRTTWEMLVMTSSETTVL